MLMTHVGLANKNALTYKQAKIEIHQRKIAQENLKKSEKNVRSFAESVPDVLYKLDYETMKYEFLSPVIESMLGYGLDEILSDPAGFSRKTIHKDDLQNSLDIINKHIQHGMVNKPVHIECRMVKKDNSIIWVRDSIKFEYRKGKIIAAVGAMCDITEEKMLEEQRRKRDERIIKFQSSLLELSKIHSLSISENSRIISKIAAGVLSDCSVAIWLFNNDETQISCLSRYDAVSEIYCDGIEHDAGKYTELFRTLRNDEFISFKSTKPDPLKADSNPLLHADTAASLIIRINFHGRVAGFLCIESTDSTRNEWLPEEYDYCVSVSGFITLALESEERLQAENEIKRSLKDKELLLREIHHRVKNNLAVISSLLYLQSKKIPAGMVNDILIESQNRIKSMVMIHEKLYKSEDLSTINYGEYISELTGTLFLNYMIDPNKIVLKLDIGNFLLDTDTAVHCGLIINEIVSNTIKHAFPGESNGLLSIYFHEISENNFRLTVSDNGIGLKSDFNINKQDTLGMQLISTLVAQMNGELIISSENGTEFDIKFSLNKNKKL